jgi:tetratricopeptide (TPR) repeat protein
MPAHIACPSCHARLRLTEQLPENSRIGCSRCGKSFETRIPSDKATSTPSTVSPVQPFFSTGALVGVTGVLAVCLCVIVAILLADNSDTRRKGDDTPRTDPNPAEEPLAREEQGVEVDPKLREAEQQKRREFDRKVGQGDGALAADRLEEAQAAYLDAIRLFPEDREAAARLEKVTAKIGKKKEEEDRRKREAERIAEARAKEAREAEEARRLEAKRLAVNAAEKGEKAAGEEEKRIAAKAFDDQMETGRKTLAANQAREALAAFKEALELSPDNPQATRQVEPLQKAIDKLDAGLASLKEKRYRSAIKDLDEFGKLYPHDAEGKRERARAAREMQAAHGMYQSLCTLATIARRNRQYEKALEYVNRAVATFPDARENAATLASAKLQLEMAKKNCETLVSVGDAALNSGRAEDAEAAFRQAIDIFPEGTDAPEKFRTATVQADRVRLARVQQAIWQQQVLLQQQRAGMWRLGAPDRPKKDREEEEEMRKNKDRKNRK